MTELPSSMVAAVTDLIGSIHKATIISHSNNRVYRVETVTGTFVAKWISDPTVDALAEKRILDLVGDNQLFRPLTHAVQVVGANAQLAIAPFIDGAPLSQVLDTNSFSEKDAECWASDLRSIFSAVARIQVHGFGRPWSPYPLVNRWTEFLHWYLHRQRDKAPLLAARYFSRLLTAFEQRRAEFDEAVPIPTLILADVNARNFLVRKADRRLMVIHSPIIWHGDPAVPFGEASVHLDRTAICDALVPKGAFPDWRLDWYAAFAAYTILAFAERFDPTPIDKVTAWGGRRPLVAILAERLSRLEQ